MINSDELAGMDAAAQAGIVATGTVTPVELIDAAVERIERLNPQINWRSIDASSLQRMPSLHLMLLVVYTRFVSGLGEGAAQTLACAAGEVGIVMTIAAGPLCLGTAIGRCLLVVEGEKVKLGAYTDSQDDYHRARELGQGLRQSG